MGGGGAPRARIATGSAAGSRCITRRRASTTLSSPPAAIRAQAASTRSPQRRRSSGSGRTRVADRTPCAAAPDAAWVALYKRRSMSRCAPSRQIRVSRHSPPRRTQRSSGIHSRADGNSRHPGSRQSASENPKPPSTKRAETRIGRSRQPRERFDRRPRRLAESLHARRADFPSGAEREQREPFDRLFQMEDRRFGSRTGECQEFRGPELRALLRAVEPITHRRPLALGCVEPSRAGPRRPTADVSRSTRKPAARSISRSARSAGKYATEAGR